MTRQLQTVNLTLTLHEARVLLDTLSGQYNDTDCEPRRWVAEKVARKFAYASDPDHPRYEGFGDQDLKDIGVL
jgi:hypothetical protein